MIRIFNHYVRAAALRGMLFDLALIVLVAVVSVGLQISSLGQAVPLAGSQVVSFAACVFVISSASGLYESTYAASFGRSVVRVGLVLAVALPITWAIFGLLPSSFAHRESIQWSTMAGVAALTLRRAYIAHSSATAAGRTRVLIFGAGPAALVVANTLRASDPNVHIVGFLSGPNEREPAVPLSQILVGSGTLPQMASRLAVDEIIVALTERRSGSIAAAPAARLQGLGRQGL